MRNDAGRRRPREQWRPFGNSGRAEIREHTGDAEEVVRCPGCGRIILAMISAMPGTVIRHKCHCNAWVYILVTAISTA